MRININNSNDKFYRYKMDSVEITNFSSKKPYTMINNIESICKELGHPSTILVKYIANLFSTSCNESKKSLNGIYNMNQIQDAIYSYINNFVLCIKCNIPEIIPFIQGTKKNKVLSLKCNACGHINNINSTDKNIIKGIDIILKYLQKNEWKVSKGIIVENKFDPFSNILDF
jgi:translation initiation factor 2 beta subunit (eIF-2beta)/eIF-5